MYDTLVKEVLNEDFVDEQLPINYDENSEYAILDLFNDSMEKLVKNIDTKTIILAYILFLGKDKYDCFGSSAYFEYKGVHTTSFDKVRDLVKQFDNCWTTYSDDDRDFLDVDADKLTRGQLAKIRDYLEVTLEDGFYLRFKGLKTYIGNSKSNLAPVLITDLDDHPDLNKSFVKNYSYKNFVWTYLEDFDTLERELIKLAKDINKITGTRFSVDDLVDRLEVNASGRGFTFDLSSLQPVKYDKDIYDKVFSHPFFKKVFTVNDLF